MTHYDDTTYIEAGDMSSDVDGATIDMKKLRFISFVGSVSSASTPSGTLKIQVSNDNSTWVDTSTTASVSGNGDNLLELTDSGARYVRLKYASSSGSATLDASVHAKG